MAWSVLDRASNGEAYKPTVCLDDIKSNFSIAVSSVLENRLSSTEGAVKPPPRIQSFVRAPFAAVCIDRTLLVLKSGQDEPWYVKTFDVPARCFLIRQREDVLVFLLDDARICSVNIDTGFCSYSHVDELKDNSSLGFVLERDDDSIILVGGKTTSSNYLLDIHNEEEGSSCSMVPLKNENIDEKISIQIEALRSNMSTLYNSVLCLKPSTNGNLHLSCPITHQNCAIGRNLNIIDAKPFGDCNKLLLLSDFQSSNSKKLSIVDFFGLAAEFKIDVGPDCFLIGALNNFVLYGETKNENVFVYVVKEISPLCQLEILIALQNYEGAEQFARANKLSPAAVIEIKAKCLLATLKKSATAEGIRELQNILSAYDNVEFVVNCCCEGVKANLDLCPLLEFSKKKLLNSDNVKLNKKIDDLLWRSEAFKLIRYESEGSLEWDAFVADGAINICKRFIVADMLDGATLVWMKSYRSIAPMLKVRDVADLLCSISLDTKLNSLLRWLEYFIPSINAIMPHSADLIITWAKDRICVLENSMHWPEVGIQFAEKFSNLMFNSSGLISFVPPSTEKVYYLINCMTQIQTLKNEYNIPISLRDFTTLSGNELCKLILRKAFTEDLEGLLKSFLEDFVIKHALNHDNLIHDHIEEMISLSPSVDEIRMNILLNAIYNADEKYQCVLLVLKSASVPWSKDIKRIADSAISSKHVLVPKIQMEIIHADIRGLLMKYKCYDLDPGDFEYLIQVILKKGDSDMMKDIEKVTKVYSGLKDDAYLLCIHNYIGKGAIHKALEVFEKIEKKSRAKCIDSLTIALENQLNCPKLNKQLEFNYIDFLKSSNIADQKTLTYLTNIYTLKNRYQIRISYSEYCIEDCRALAFNNWYIDKLNDVNQSRQDTEYILKQSYQIAHYLKFSKIECISLFLNHASIEMAKDLANIILLDKSFFLDKDIKTVDLILNLIPMVNIADITIIDNCLRYLAIIIGDCNPRKLPYCIDIASWLSSIYFSHNHVREVVNTWNITSFYNPHIINPVNTVWKEIIGRNSIESYENKTVSMCICNCENQCLDGSICLKIALSKFQAQQNDINFVRLIAYCCNCFLNNDKDIPRWLLELNDCTIKILLSKMINAECIDHLLMSVLLFSYSGPGDWLNDILKGPIQKNKKVSVAHHILQCHDLYRSISGFTMYKQAFTLYSQSIIENKLEYNGIALQGDNEGSYNIPSLLESFIHTKTCNFDILEEFCTVTNTDFDQTLIYYLFYLLKWWNDDYIFIYDNFEKCTILPSEDQEKIMKTCTNILMKIKHKDQLVKDLTLLFKNGEINIGNLSTINLNLYCYEAYIFILDLLKNITGTQMFLREYMLLKFLQTYQRITKPRQSELDEFSMKENFPRIGFYRLPFSYVMCDNFWNNLKPEVTLATYKQWLSIAGLLLLNVDMQVTRDMICSNAVKQSMTAEKNLHEGTNIKWTLHMKNDRLLKEAHECIQHITNLEWAGACFYYVYQGSALGADQVAAIDMCYQFAEHWAKVEPNHNNVKKMQVKHLLTSSAHVLHKIGLAEDKLLSLCDNPHRLIEALYNHDSIITKYDSPNINNAVDEIAEKHNLNAGAIRMRMLEKILNKENALCSDSSMNRSMSVTDGSLSKNALLKARYILKGINQTMATIYLSRIGLGTTDLNPNVSFNSNVRALQCLLSLADSEVIENVTSYKLGDLWAKLWELYFINCLNAIGVEYLIPLFQEDKHQIMQQLWQTRNHNQAMMSFIVKMLIIYNLQVDDILLNEIIATINKFEMTSEVKNFLLLVRSSYGAKYVDMWSRLLLTPFKQLDAPLTNQQKEECLEALKFMPLCPVTNLVDLSIIWKTCLRLGAIDMAVIVLPHLSESNVKAVVKSIGKVRKSTLQELKLFKSKGILTTNSAMAILKEELSK